MENCQKVNKQVPYTIKTTIKTTSKEKSVIPSQGETGYSRDFIQFYFIFK